MTARKRKGDKKLAEGLELEGFVMAGTPSAFEALPPGQAAAPRCVRCAAPISNVFLTSKGPMGGDCLATLTGDQSTRRLARKLSQKLGRVMNYREVRGLRVKPSHHGDYNVVAVSIDRNDYDPYSGLFGSRTDYLITAKREQLPVLLAIVGYEAESRGLDFETEGIEQIEHIEENPFRQAPVEEPDRGHLWPIMPGMTQIYSSDKPGSTFLKKIGDREWRLDEMESAAEANPEMVWGGEEPDDIEEDPWEFAADQGVRVLSHLDWHSGYVDDDGRLVAALFTGVSGDEYEFDIVVAPSHRRQGLASELMDAAIANYEELLEPSPDLVFSLDVINPISRKMLEKRGFRVVGGTEERPLMARNPRRKMPRHMDRPELDARDVIEMARRGQDVSELAGKLAGDWLEYSAWCAAHGYNSDEPEAIADDLMEIEMEFAEGNPDDYVEVQSGLFRESGVNASTNEETIDEYAGAMVSYDGTWGEFSPIHGVLQTVWEDDVEEYLEAEEEGLEHELAWSRPLTWHDVGIEYVAVEDGHNRAYAAASLHIPIRVKVWE